MRQTWIATACCGAAWVVLSGTTGCVSAKKYDASLRDARAARVELEQSSAEWREHKQYLETQATDLQRAVDDETAQNAELRRELTRLGTDADALLAEKGALASALAESRSRLEELRRARAAAEARTQFYRGLVLRLKQMIDGGDLSIALREGRMVLQLPNDVLFDTGRTAIKSGGQRALTQVAAVLATLTDRHFQVTGHTDDVPIATAKYASNWELSTARGLEVVHFLIAHGVLPTNLAAAGYGEFDPVASNADPEGRARNRRIEIALQPNVDELVHVPESE